MPSLRELHNQRAITLNASQLQRLDSIERLFINRRMNAYIVALPTSMLNDRIIGG